MIEDHFLLVGIIIEHSGDGGGVLDNMAANGSLHATAIFNIDNILAKLGGSFSVKIEDIEYLSTVEERVRISAKEQIILFSVRLEGLYIII